MKVKGTPHDKLREAKFFLERLEHSNNDDDLEALDFDHYLSAFLSAGESVVEVLRKTHNPGFGPLRAAWLAQLEPDDRSLFDFMTSQRDEVVHRAAVGSDREVEHVDWITWMSRRPGITVSGYPERMREHKLGVLRHYVTLNSAKYDAVVACSAYLELLQGLVARAEA